MKPGVILQNSIACLQDGNLCLHDDPRTKNLQSAEIKDEKCRPQSPLQREGNFSFNKENLAPSSTSGLHGLIGDNQLPSLKFL